MDIENQVFQKERALYNIKDANILNCKFEGEEDGESPLKECENIQVIDSFFALRYALWHDEEVIVNNCEFTDKCRAPYWYSNKVDFTESKINGVKAFRECNGLYIADSTIISPEVLWRCRGVEIRNTTIESEYAFFESKYIELFNVKFSGKYSFQYVNGMSIEDSSLDTKDAFWHTKNVVVKNSYLKGEYLGWYSENLTLINCKIESHQPLCYCKNLVLVDCEFINSDLAFEYSDVKATIKGKIDSVKNPLKGKIIAENIGDVIKTDDKYPSKAKIIIGGNKK